MKSLFIVAAFAVASLSVVACNNSSKSSSANAANDTTAKSPAAAAAVKKSGVDVQAAESVKGVVGDYLQLKNALASDNSNDAATAGKALTERFKKFDTSALTAAQMQSFKDIADDAAEMAEHIGQSAGKLPHQREHFDMLSKDMIDLVKLFGAGLPLYVDHCPMYNNNKGADWLSETKDIKNPYLGAKMPTCGSVKEELK